MSAQEETQAGVLIIRSHHPSFEWTRSIHEIKLSSLITGTDNNAFKMLYGYRERIFERQMDQRRHYAGGRFSFDYRRLKASGVSLNQLPGRSFVRFLPDVFCRHHPVETGLAVVLLGVLCLALAVTSWLLRQRAALLKESKTALVMHGLNERRLETLETLRSLEHVDESETVLTVLNVLVNITDSATALAMVKEGRSKRTYAFSEGKGSCYRVSAGIRKAFDQIEAGEPGGMIVLDGLEINLGDGIFHESHEDGTNISLSIALFGGARFAIGDRRQLNLLCDGAWRILARHRSEQKLLELNRDLEKRVRTRSEELRVAEVELIRSEKLAFLGSLVAGITHEVNTPLGLAVTGSSFLRNRIEDISRQYDNDELEVEEFRDFLETGEEVASSIATNLSRATEMMRSFKQVAVDQTGEKPRLFNFSVFLNEFLLSIKSELKKTGVRMDLKCPLDLVLHHFPGDLWRVLSNLVMNALKHGFGPDSGKSGSDRRIHINIGCKDHKVELSCADNGTGISGKILPRIFDPFFTTAKDSGGTGLGLHLVRSIIEDRHDGHVRVEQPGLDGRGVMFVLEFTGESPLLTPSGTSKEN